MMKSLVEFNGVSFSYPGDRGYLFQGFDWLVSEGQFWTVVGGNGGGKTTLLKLLLRLLSPQQGQVTYAKSLNIGYLPQRTEIDHHFPISVSQVIESGLMNKRENRNEIHHILQLVRMEGFKDSLIGQLSGGQLQRVLLGRALIGSPDLLVMDEPTSFLDQGFEQTFLDILSELKSSTTIIMATHDMDKLSELVTDTLRVDISPFREGNY